MANETVPPWMLSRVDGAYYGKILICAPMSCQRRGLLRQNPYLRPDIPVSTGLITAKFLICAPISRCRWGLLRQNSFLRPDIPLLTGLITAKSLSVPRCTKVEGIIDLILSHIPASAKADGYIRPDFVSHTRVCEGRWVYST